MSRRNAVGLLVVTLWSCTASSTGGDAGTDAGLDAGADAGANAPGVLMRSSRARATTAAPAADLDAAVYDANELTMKLFRAVPGAGNVAVSPWSVELALAMASAGAAGTTKDAFAAVLHPSLPDDRFHAALNTIDQSLMAQAPGARDAGTFALDVNDQLFTALGLQPQPAFLDTLAESYGAGVRQVDFAGAPDAARGDINQWVSDTTRGLIPELLAPGTVTSGTRLALVNTIYFAARWKYPFDPNVTRDAAFTLLDGTTKQVPTMTGCYVLSAAAAVGGVDVLELSYAAGDLAMVLLVPPQGGLATFEQTLDAQTLAGLLAGSQYSPSCLSMPRFEVSTHASLRSALSTLGLGVAFSPDADFSGMTGAKGLAMDGVEHEAKVKVDESGTVAAAATYIPMAGGSPPAHIDVNRAFVFLVRDRATGLVLFAGHVVDP